MTEVPPDAEADSALMERLQNGDDLALNELMARWEKPVLNFVFRFVGDQADAVDLAQETFVRVYEQRARFSRQGKFSSWLFAIASNLCKNHLRWRRRHPAVSMDRPSGEDEESFQQEHADPANQPWENAAGNESAAAVKAAIQRLPEQQRTAVLLFFYQELSYQEIAGALRCTAKAVENKLRHARETLAKYLHTNQ